MAVAAAALIALVAYADLLESNVVRAVGGPDSSGYMNEARLIASGRTGFRPEPMRRMRLDASWIDFFTPVGFRSAPGGRIVPSYPPGLPFHFALAALIGGWRLPFYVSPLLALGAIALTFGIARELGLSRWWSFCAAAMLAALPVFLSSAIQPMSDVPATFWSVCAVWLALRARRSPSLAFAAGAAVGIGVWVRPTNLLVALAVAVALRFRWPLLWRSALAAIPFGAAILWWNHALFGDAFRNGYGTLSDMLTWAAFPKCGAYHLTMIVRSLTPLVPLSLFLVLPLRAVDRWTRALLFSWFSIFFLFYAAYDMCTDWWDIRFVMPAIPALLIATLLVVTRLPRFVAVALVAVILWTSIAHVRQYQVLYFDEHEEQWPSTIRWAESRLPPDSLVISGILGGAFLHYGNRVTVRWDLLDDQKFQELRAYAGIAGLHWYAVTSAVADIKPEEFEKRYDARWERVGELRDITLWRLAE